VALRVKTSTLKYIPHSSACTLPHKHYTTVIM